MECTEQEKENYLLDNGWTCHEKRWYPPLIDIEGHSGASLNTAVVIQASADQYDEYEQ